MKTVHSVSNHITLNATNVQMKDNNHTNTSAMVSPTKML